MPFQEVVVHLSGIARQPMWGMDVFNTFAQAELATR
jgi:hypothetical protein